MTLRTNEIYCNNVYGVMYSNTMYLLTLFVLATNYASFSNQ